MVGQARDKPVRDEIQCLFEDWNSELPLVSTFKTQRAILNESRVDCSIQLHDFVGASQSAMCAVAYLRSIQCETVVVWFLVSKCRVAPIRAKTTPKFELHAAVIGLRLSMYIQFFYIFSVRNVSFGATAPGLLNGFRRLTNVFLFSLLIVWQNSQTVVMLNNGNSFLVK